MKRFQPEQKPATLTEVAREAGVALGTASRVLNGHPSVSPGKRRAVHEAMDRLGYRPAAAARSMRRASRGRTIWTGNIGFCLLNMAPEQLEVQYLARLLHSAQTELLKNGYTLLLDYAHDGELPDLVRNRKVEGVLLHAHRGAPDDCRALARELPTVIIGQENTSLGLPAVYLDNTHAVTTIVLHLRELGHERIAFVTNEESHIEFARREAAFREVHSMLSAPLRPEYVQTSDTAAQQAVSLREREPAVMDELVAPLLGLAEPPTAIVCANDWTAIGVYRALRRRDVRIPQEISVVGIDNDLQLCEALDPPLTSFDLASDVIARECVSHLLRMVRQREDEDDSRLSSLAIQGRLVERASVRRVGSNR